MTVAALVDDDHVPQVSFDFRFDRDTREHDRRLELRTALAIEFAKSRVKSSTIESLKFYPVSRAGKSGSEVFYLDLYLFGTEYPRQYIAKFQSVRATEREYESSTLAAHAAMTSDAHFAIDRDNDLGVIVSDLARVPNHCEYRAFFLNLDKSEEECAIALASVFESIGKKQNSRNGGKLLIEDYRRYITRKSAPLERIHSLISAEPHHSMLAEIGTSIVGNYKRIENELNKPIYPYLVHGDLHARNLMLSSTDPRKTELIDFGWVHHGHPAKDFVLMESTLKYMLLQEVLPLFSRPPSESFHIPLVAYEKFEVFLCKHGFSLPPFDDLQSELSIVPGIFSHHISALRRVYEPLIVLRAAAGQVLRDYSQVHLDGQSSAEQQFFSSMFLIVLGLSAFSEMEPIRTLIGLRIVGDHIWNV